MCALLLDFLGTCETEERELPSTMIFLNPSAINKWRKCLHAKASTTSGLGTNECGTIPTAMIIPSLFLKSTPETEELHDGLKLASKLALINSGMGGFQRSMC
ncbi:hypothetical protein V6N13_137262 [Hibiscus sabdariffa]|uniref:Uncharacterized protein n=1 Tax=Hibiscus sabdariffa TaxID=183260 RepID=A0ABR2DM08_9ROSI